MHKHSARDHRPITPVRLFSLGFRLNAMVLPPPLGRDPFRQIDSMWHPTWGKQRWTATASGCSAGEFHFRASGARLGNPPGGGRHALASYFWGFLWTAVVLVLPALIFEPNMRAARIRSGPGVYLVWATKESAQISNRGQAMPFNVRLGGLSSPTGVASARLLSPLWRPRTIVRFGSGPIMARRLPPH